MDRTEMNGSAEGSEKYLDTAKSVIISSPAGSGKTEKLARRYISLLKAGSDVQKILAITFTERAAAEMKERILNILEREDSQLLAKLRPMAPLMRISTIHAFCLRLLKRFSMELGLDPSLGVMDELEARELWLESIYELLRAERGGGADFFRLISQRGLRGWTSVWRALDVIHAKRPYPEMMIAEGTRLVGEAREVFDLYAGCLDAFTRKKTDKGLLDFQDLEVLALKALSGGTEWQNILYAFDEHTDHLLVDEFQDTSTIQWKIIEKLTEEWRAGMGAKREAGKTPTIFLVGDEKQSIYRFRGANVSVFHHAKETFGQWLKGEYHFEEATENYRSLPAIVDFANRLFGVIMPNELVRSWKTRYTPFKSTRDVSRGTVELVSLTAGANTKETRQREAKALARLIKSLNGEHEVFDPDEQARKCKFGDMAVLLKKRTHLALFEDAMRAEGVPFVILKGIGFYEAPEVAVLRELISFVVDREDRYSLFSLLRSPLFGLDYPSVTRIIRSKDPLEKLRASKSPRQRDAYEALEGWGREERRGPLSSLIERALTETGAWRVYWERQRHANIKKFISLIESYEAAGLTPLEIREKLLRQRHSGEVAKANVNAEGMDAVRVLTIHAAKGLQFPMVFLPSMDESIRPSSGPVVIDDEDGGLLFDYEEDNALRAKNTHFRTDKLKQEEEEKRLLYVAVTRARNYLCMLGSVSDGGKPTGRLEYLYEAFGLGGKDGPVPPLLKILSEEDCMGEDAAPGGTELADAGDFFVDAPRYTEPLQYNPTPTWRDVSSLSGITHAHGGKDWQAAGRAVHRVLEDLSNGTLMEKDITERAEELLASEGLGRNNEYVRTIINNILNMKRSGLLDEVVMPKPHSYTEMPFVMQLNDIVYSGRIDRVVLKQDYALVVDYKTSPVREDEIPGLIENYRSQVEIYRLAAEQLFKMPARAYLLFTSIPRMVEVQTPR